MTNKYTKIKLLAFSMLAAFTGANAQTPATATVQIIHNVAAPAAAQVDVYVNTVKVLDNVAFRKASPFTPLTAGIPLKVTINLPTSTSTTDGVLLDKNISALVAGQSYVIIASGVPASTAVPAPFSPNPNPAISTALDLLIKQNAKRVSTLPANVDVSIVHGVTDAPGIDVIAAAVGGSGTTRIVDNATYSAITDYTAVPATSYTLNVKDSLNTSTQVYRSFSANLDTLAGKAIVVFASGFLTPSTNSNGPAFGLFAALPSGQVVTLPLIPTLSTTRFTAFEGVTVFPVPATDRVYVNLGNATGNASVEVSDITGRTVQTINNVNLAGNLELNVANYNAGEYFIKIVGDNNVSVVKCAVVK